MFLRSIPYIRLKYNLVFKTPWLLNVKDYFHQTDPVSALKSPSSWKNIILLSPLKDLFEQHPFLHMSYTWKSSLYKSDFQNVTPVFVDFRSTNSYLFNTHVIRMQSLAQMNFVKLIMIFQVQPTLRQYTLCIGRNYRKY